MNSLVRGLFAVVILLLATPFLCRVSLWFFGDTQGGAYNLAGIPVPYSFKTFQALSTLESFTVGGNGGFLFFNLW